MSEKGVEPDPEKIKAVVERPKPKDTVELRSFTGICSYNRLFITELSEVAAPLFDLTRKDGVFNWDTCSAVTGTEPKPKPRFLPENRNRNFSRFSTVFSVSAP